MKRAAIGVRMHSGWGALVGVAGRPDTLEVIDRRRIVVIDASGPRANQPYHHAAELPLPEAEKYLSNCAEVSRRLAVAAMREVVEQLKTRGYRVTGAGILLAGGRALPSLAEILTAHPLIHTAEGQFFRSVARQACEQLQIPVVGLRERELDERSKSVFGPAARRVQKRILALGESLGPPWTQDQKTAALAAALALRGRAAAGPEKSSSGVADLRSNKKHLRFASVNRP
jgi:hypothetical protein